jgi:hypothetical protein
VTAVWRKKEGLGEPEHPVVWLGTSYHRIGVGTTLPRKVECKELKIVWTHPCWLYAKEGCRRDQCCRNKRGPWSKKRTRWSRLPKPMAFSERLPSRSKNGEYKNDGRCSLLQQKKGLQPRDPDLRSRRRWESRRKRQVRGDSWRPGRSCRTPHASEVALNLGTLTAFGGLARLSFFHSPHLRDG